MFASAVGSRDVRAETQYYDDCCFLTRTPSGHLVMRVYGICCDDGWFLPLPNDRQCIYIGGWCIKKKLCDWLISRTQRRRHNLSLHAAYIHVVCKYILVYGSNPMPLVLPGIPMNHVQGVCVYGRVATRVNVLCFCCTICLTICQHTRFVA